MENLTLPQVKGLIKYWRSHPPVHVLVAACMGIKPEVEVKEEDQAKAVSELMAMPGVTFQG